MTSQQHRSGDDGSDEAMRAELEQAERAALRKIDPGVGALVIAVVAMIVVVAEVLPWVGPAAGWQVMLGHAEGGPLPRIFSITSGAFGVVLTTAGLMARRWWLAWCCAVLCGMSTFEGLIAIWSRQTSHAAGPGPGLILAMVCMLVLAASWLRYAWSRP